MRWELLPQAFDSVSEDWKRAPARSHVNPGWSLNVQLPGYVSGLRLSFLMNKMGK